MTPEETAQRLEKLERDNKRLKRSALCTVIVLAALGGIYATQPVPDKITAREFEVVDASGKPRVRLVSEQGEAYIVLLDADNTPAASMLVDKSGRPAFSLFHAFGKLPGANKPRAIMGLSGDGSPGIRLYDARGFELDLGSTSTVAEKTGELHQSSAASITMFGNAKDHHVIWQAP